MKKIVVALLLTCAISSAVFAQNKLIRPRALGVSFIMNDFTTPERIRNTTLSTVFREKQWSKLKDMSPGLSLSYIKGLTPHTDFAGTFAISSVDDPLRNDASGDALFLETDASVNLKMLDEGYWFTPYLSAGVGASKFQNYYAAFLPLGLGFKVNLFDEAAISFGTQYRIPVTEATNYHFMYSFGISGVIGK